MNDDPCFVELFKLRKMFESSFKIRGPGDQNAIEHLYSNDKVTINFLLRPTDPDFDTSVLSTPEGIDIDLTLHRVSGPKATDSPARYARSPKTADPNESPDHSAAPETTVEFFYQVNGLEDVRVNDPALPDLFKKSIQKVLSDYIVKNRTARRYVVYESLKFLDKNLARIYSISNSLKSQAPGQVSQELQPPAETQADPRAQVPPDRESRETPWTLEEQKW